MPRKGKEPAGLRRWRLAHRKGKSRRSGRSMSRGESHAPGFAAVYVNAKTGLQVLSPAVDVAGSLALRQRSTSDVPGDLKGKFVNSDYALGLISSVAQRAVDNHFHQTQALARKSVTAAAPEIYALVKTYDEAKGQGKYALRGAPGAFVSTTTGFDPVQTKFDWKSVAPYAGIKYGGIVVRKALNAFPVLGRPVKSVLHMAGLTA